MAFRYVLPSLAVAGLAAAQSCSVAGTTTISSAAQATALASCSTFQGSIALGKSTTDQIALDGIQHIKGSLIANDVPHLTSLSADSLSTIDDSFTLVDCPALSSLNFPDLSDVANIHWVGLATLQGLSFTTGVQLANTVLIDNTNLGSLDGINLQMVEAMQLTNNGYLQMINMQLSNISDELIISANGRNVDLSLPNLISANNLNIQNVSSIDLASLSSVNGTFGFYANFVDSLLCPNLTYVGKTLALDNNAQLTTVSFPELKTIEGAMQIQNNTAFKNATGFPKVATVGGAVSLYGVFTTVPLPALNTVRGAFDIVSSAVSKTLTSQCDHYKSIHGTNNVIQGSGFNCTGGTSGASTQGGHSGSGTGSGTSSSSTPSSSSSAAHSILISGTTGVLGVVAALFGML